MNKELFNPTVYAKVYQWVRSYILKNSGTIEDFEDILQEGLLQYFKKFDSKTFLLTSAPENLIMKICRNLWLKELSKRKRKSISVFVELISDEDNIFQQERDEYLLGLVNKNLNLLTEKCRLAIRYWMEGKTCEQMSVLLGLKNYSIAKDKVFRCKKKLWQLILSDDDFVNSELNES